MPNGVEASNETIVPSQKDKRKRVRTLDFVLLNGRWKQFILSFQVAVPQSSPSLSTDSGVGETRRRTHEDEEAGPSSHSTNSKEDSVVDTENVDVKPDVLSDATQLPVTNGFGKRGIKRRISDDDDDFEYQGLPDLTKSRKDLRSLPKREIPLVVTLESSDEESNRYFVFCIPFNYSVYNLFIFSFCL